MAKNNNQPLLKSGSTGSDVKKMQQGLIKAGYDVGKAGADGIYGPDTTRAVKQYQKDNGLAMDGIAGRVTLGALYATAVTADGDVANSRAPLSKKEPKGKLAGKTPAEPDAPAEPAAPPPTFSHVPSATVQAANQLLQQHMNGRPGAYQSQWQDEINKYMDQYINRDPFSYDFNSDALYQMYKDQYIQQGQMAMMDTMGQAAAMTGGYGNSYAQTVGQQVYNQQLAQLNNIIPELYQMAYGKYRDEGQDLLNAYNMYMDRENMDYGRYQDDLSNWWRETEYLTGRADTEYERDYNSQWDSYTAENDNYWKEYSANYQEGRDAIEDQKDQRDWIAGMISAGFEPSDEDLAAAGMTRAEADALKNAYTASVSKGGDKNNNGGNEVDGGTDYKDLDVGSTAYNTISKAIARATSLDELNAITQEYLALGYDPEQIKAMIKQKLKELEGDGAIDTTVPSLGSGVGGGGGGGRMLIEAW